MHGTVFGTSAFELCHHISVWADVKRKVLPAWLRDSLEKLDRDRQKKMEKESKEGAKGDQGRPAWWNEVEEKGVDSTEPPGVHSSNVFRNSKSQSPDQVSVCV